MAKTSLNAGPTSTPTIFMSCAKWSIGCTPKVKAIESLLRGRLGGGTV